MQKILFAVLFSVLVLANCGDKKKELLKLFIVMIMMLVKMFPVVKNFALSYH